MVREQAIATAGMWSGLVRTEASMTSGWHHHGDYETAIYVLSGRLRMESGLAGSKVVEAGPGDFVYVPRHKIHREATRAGRKVDSSSCGPALVSQFSMSMGRRTS